MMNWYGPNADWASRKHVPNGNWSCYDRHMRRLYTARDLVRKGDISDPPGTGVFQFLRWSFGGL